MVLTLIALFLNSAFAQYQVDQLGEFKIESLRVQVQGQQKESSTGGFKLNDSWLRFSWSLKDDLDAISSVFELGTPDLTRESLFFNPKNKSELVLTQVWLRYKGKFADTKVGLMPVPFSNRGVLGFDQNSFPKSQWEEQFWFPQRDFGIEFHSHYGQYDTRIMVHNGESSTENLDGRFWASSAWSYIPSDELKFSVSAMVGQTKSESTASATAQNFGFSIDPNANSKIRVVSFLAAKSWAKRSWLAEYGLGDILQPDQEKKKFGFGLLQSSWPIAPSTSILGRVSQIHSDYKEVNSLTRGYGLGFEFRDQKEVLSLTVFGEKREEKNQVQNDLLTVQFRLNTLR